MQEIKMTVELCEADRARLDAILEALKTSRCDSCVENVTATFERLHGKAEPSEPWVSEPTHLSAPAPAPAPAPAVTVDMIRQKVVSLSAAGKKEQVRRIVLSVASGVSNIPEDKLSDVWTQLVALEG